MDQPRGLDQYVSDNASQDPRKVDFVTAQAIDLGLTRWTSDTWPDGVPVTKGFRRNRRQRLSLPAGTRIVGVTYRGWDIDVTVLDFFMNGTWYSVVDNTAEALLDLEPPTTV